MRNNWGTIIAVTFALLLILAGFGNLEGKSSFNLGMDFLNDGISILISIVAYRSARSRYQGLSKANFIRIFLLEIFPLLVIVFLIFAQNDLLNNLQRNPSVFIIPSVAIFIALFEMLRSPIAQNIATADVARTQANKKSDPIADKSTLKITTQNTNKNLTDEQIYSSIASEIENRDETLGFNLGLWTKLFVECNGDERQIQIQYIKTRFNGIVTIRERLNKPIRPMPSKLLPPDKSELRVGDRIFHEQHGDGFVLNCERYGGSVLVRFEEDGYEVLQNGWQLYRYKKIK
jgi:hypothetical protein